MPSLTSLIAVLSLVGASLSSPVVNEGRLLAPEPDHAAAHASVKIPPGTAANCKAYHLVVPDETCFSIGMTSGLTVKEFKDFNPAINADCSNLIPGYSYCINAPTKPEILPRAPADTPVPIPSAKSIPAQPPASPPQYVPAPGPTKQGASQCCWRWHTAAAGDTCRSIDYNAGITLQEFRTWNPDVNWECTNLWAGYSYCVDADMDCRATEPETTTVLTTTASPMSSTMAPTTTAALVTPAPVQVGMTAGCTRFYRAKQGDYCQAIAWEFRIDISTFDSWNPGVGQDCSGLLAGYYYCVAKSGQN